MNLPAEKFVAKQPSKYDLLKAAVLELLNECSIQIYGYRDEVHIEVQDWENFKEKVKLGL